MYNKLKLLVILGFILLLAGCNKMDSLPEGEFLSTYNSPNERYTINIYLCNGGATTSYCIRGELVDNEAGIAQNIYWCDDEWEATVKWTDNDTVTINGRTLDVPEDTYDFRREFP